ncbi:hypothetical protein D3C72_1766620 [compost metagenome]
MPFQEITLAVFAAPTRPIPQPIEPEPTRLSELPSIKRPINRLIKLSIGRLCVHADINMNTPLKPHPARPYITASLLPLLSMIFPAYGRLSRVARYCTLITNPAITVPKPRSLWT